MTQSTIPLIERPYVERLLTSTRLRKLLKRRRTSLVPEALTDFLLHRSPSIYPPDAREIAAILAESIASIESELNDAGISVDGIEDPDLSLSTRERGYIAAFSAMKLWQGISLLEVRRLADVSGEPEIDRIEVSDTPEAIQLSVEQAQLWAKTSQDLLQMAVSEMVRAEIEQDLFANPVGSGHWLRQAIITLTGVESRQASHIRLILYCQHAYLMLNNGDGEGLTEILDRADEEARKYPSGANRSEYALTLALRSTTARRRRDQEQALKLARKAIQWSRPEYDPIVHCSVLQELSLVFFELEHYEESLRTLMEAITLLESHNLFARGAWLYINGTTQYHRLGEYDRAVALLDRIEDRLGFVPESLPDNPNAFMVTSRASRADLLIQSGNLERAEEILNWAIEKSIALKISTTVVAASALAGTVATRQNNYRVAESHFARAVEYSRASSTRVRLRLILQRTNALIAAGDVEEAERMIAEIEEEIDPTINLYVTLLRQRARICEHSNDLRQALALERQAAEVEKQLLEVDRERVTRHARIVAENRQFEQAMQDEIERRKRIESELAEAVIKLGDQEKILAEIRAALQQEVSIDTSSLQQILAMTKTVDAVHSPLTYLGSSGNEFVQRLRKSYSGLTPKQERLAVLLRAGMSPNEICSIVGFGREALKSHRKRLRKVFGLEKGESLESAIANI